MKRNWRGWAARAQYYFLEGSNALTSVKQVLYVMAALKLFDVPWIYLALAAPVIYVVHVFAGYYWIRHGWFKQLQEVPVVDAVSPIQVLHFHMIVKLYQHLGITLNGTDLRTMPPELASVLSSFHPQGTR